MALALIDEVEGAPVDVKVGAFKALSSFYLAASKSGRKALDEEDAGGLSIAAMRQSVAEAGEGK